MIDFEQLQKTMAQLSPEQFRGMMIELLNTQPPGGPSPAGGQAAAGAPGLPPQSAPPPPHPTQTPGAVMRREMMQNPQPQGMLGGRY